MVGRNVLTRDSLVAIFADADAGADSPVSHLATGNISFGQTCVSGDFVERIEQSIAGVIGRTEPIFIRTVDELRESVDCNPFQNLPFDGGHERCVSFTRGPSSGLELPLATARGDAIAFAAREGEHLQRHSARRRSPRNNGEGSRTNPRAPGNHPQLEHHRANRQTRSSRHMKLVVRVPKRRLSVTPTDPSKLP